MDEKTREQAIGLGIWAVIVAIRAAFFFRNTKNLTANRIWLFTGFTVCGAFAAAVIAPIVASVRGL